MQICVLRTSNGYRFNDPQTSKSELPHGTQIQAFSLQRRGVEQSASASVMVAGLSPYMREHIRRFGQYVLDMDDLPSPLNPQPLPFELAL